MYGQKNLEKKDRQGIPSRVSCSPSAASLGADTLCPTSRVDTSAGRAASTAMARWNAGFRLATPAGTRLLCLTSRNAQCVGVATRRCTRRVGIGARHAGSSAMSAGGTARASTVAPGQSLSLSQSRPNASCVDASSRVHHGFQRSCPPNAPSALSNKTSLCRTSAGTASAASVYPNCDERLPKLNLPQPPTRRGLAYVSYMLPTRTACARADPWRRYF